MARLAPQHHDVVRVVVALLGLRRLAAGTPASISPRCRTVAGRQELMATSGSI
jgi:hypothetical protein